MLSYAQNFEDVILWRALKDVGVGFYIDIGAQDPVIDSVSRAFYDAGWRGVHVEPSPAYAAKLRRERPGEEVLQLALGKTEGDLRFFHFPDTGLSTGVEEIARGHLVQGWRVEDITVPQKTTAQVLDLYADRDIHWMKIDCEGMEADIIEGWKASSVRPWIVIVESVLPSTQTPSHEGWEEALLALGYKFVYFDGLNRFYVSNRKAELKAAFGPGPNCFDHFQSAPFNLAMRNGERELAAQQILLSRVREEVAAQTVRVGDLAAAEQGVLKTLEARTVELQTHTAELQTRAAESMRLLRGIAGSPQQAKRLAELEAAVAAERDRAMMAHRLYELLEKRLADANAETASLRGQLEQTRAELAEYRVTADHWYRTAQSFQNSTSWRLTAPVRWGKTVAARVLHPLRKPAAAAAMAAANEPALSNHANTSVEPSVGLRKFVAQKPADRSSPVLTRANKIFAQMTQPVGVEKKTAKAR
jgi:FkbM family methyltransferase